MDEERLEKTKVTEPFGYIIKPFGDNELRSTIEIALQRDTLEKVLRESEERYRMLFNSSNDAVFVHGQTRRDMPGKIVEVNDIACQKFGYTSFEITAVTKDGKKFPCEISTHLFEFKGQHTVLSIVRDITERKKREEELLEEASVYVNKSVELINRMGELEIFISSHRDLKRYSVTDVLNKVIETYPAIAFNIESEGQVLADESLSSGIDNLISNAVVHGKTDRIDINIGERGEYCEIRIADYGVGILDEIKEQIFEESFVYGKTGGTGLGLYIVKKAMETYGGHVHVEDNTPRGEFLFWH